MGRLTPTGSPRRHDGLTQRVFDVLLTGIVILAPFVIVLYLLDMALGLVHGLLGPVIGILRWVGLIESLQLGVLGVKLAGVDVYGALLGVFSELVAVLALLALVVVLGLFGTVRPGRDLIRYVDAAVISVPVVGSVYKSFRQMGDVVLESGLENFQSVKLVEFPREGLYSVGFETNQSPASIQAVAEADDVLTLFVPLAPNPVMGGFLVHVSRDRIHDVDMTVEEAARSLISSGLASGELDRDVEPSLDSFRSLGARYLDAPVGRDAGDEGATESTDGPDDR